MDAEHIRTPTYIWVEAEIRRLSTAGYGVYVISRGDKTGGTVIQKISNLQGQCKLIGQQRNIDSKLEWVNLLGDDVVDEPRADEYIRKALSRDPDLWVVEIEDRAVQQCLNYLSE